MSKKRITLVLGSLLVVAIISILLAIGEKASAPVLTTSTVTQAGTPTTKSWTNPMYDSPPFPKNASNPNYTVLCINKADVKKEFTKTGKFVTCPVGFYTVPADSIPKAKSK
jgi:hypothetical protein